jgi:CRP-like cAMP-binding protein
MSGQCVIRQYPETRFASGEREQPLASWLAPRQNRILAALPDEDYARLLPCLEPVALPLGWTMHAAGERQKHLYFLTSGIAARYYVTENGVSAGCAITGSEGVIGEELLLGGDSTPSQAVVLHAGHAHRLAADRLRNECGHGGALAHLLLRYTLALVAQVGQIAVCNRHHSVEQRLCHWILSSLDRVRSNQLTMTHEVLADMLGVRRAGVADAARKLRETGLIQYSRGRIGVLDRSRLEAEVCECYAVVKREYERLLPAHQQVGVASAPRPSARPDWQLAVPSYMSLTTS